MQMNLTATHPHDVQSSIINEAAVAAPPPLALADITARIAAVRSEMAKQGIGAALFTTPESIYYLSGYQTRAITASQSLLMSKTDVILIIRRIDEGNYLAIKDRSPITRVVTFQDAALQSSPELTASLLLELVDGSRVFGAEPDSPFVSARQFGKLTAAMGDYRMFDVGSFVDDLRLIKSPWEIECHRAAAQMTMSAMRHGIEAVKVGALDSDVAAKIAFETIRAGSEWAATWPIILTGKQTGRAHSSWQHLPIRTEQPTSLEFAAVARRYHSPLFRSVIISPTSEQVRMIEAIAEAHAAGVKAIRPGVCAEDPYFAERKILEKHGFADLLAARVGYSVGIAFAPNWVQRNGIDLVNGNRTELKSGMVFHMVTILLQPDEFGIAHSSTVAVTPEGSQVLTNDGLIAPIIRRV